MATDFHVADIVVFVTTVVVSLAIGIYYAVSGGRQKTTSEYLVGGRALSFIPVSVSLLASFESSIMMLGLPAEGYFYGTQLVAGIFGSLFTYLMAAHAMVPIMYSLQITSAFEYLDLRFQSKIVRRLGTAMGMLNYVWYMGIVLFGPAVALEAVTGFPLWVSIIAICTVSVIYTSVGGIKAVIWTDVFQCLVMLMGMFAILIKGTLDVGGAKKVWDVAMDGGRLELFNFDPNPMVRHTFWALTFGSIFRNMAFVFNQGTVQRISSTRNLKEARRVVYIVAPCFSFVTMVAIYEGVVAYSYYQTKGCDPLENGQITNDNQLLPYMVMDIFKDLPGMPGLFLASLFSASLSTLSTGLSSLSAISLCDVIRPLAGGISDKKEAFIAKISVFLFGGVACGIAFLVALIGGTLHQISFSILASFSTPIAGLFFLGIFCPRVTAKGAFTGGVVGLLICCWVSFGMNFSPNVIPSPQRLQPASIDRCFVTNTSTTIDIFSQQHPVVTSSHNNSQYTIAVAVAGTTDNYTDTSEDSVVEGIDILYNLSYNWIPVIGMVTTVIVGYITSLITGPNKPGDVDPRYLLEVSKAITYFLPSRLQTWLSSFGTQFIKDEYRVKLSSPVLQVKVKETCLNTDVVVKSPSNKQSECQLLNVQNLLQTEKGNGQLGPDKLKV